MTSLTDQKEKIRKEIKEIWPEYKAVKKRYYQLDSQYSDLLTRLMQIEKEEAKVKRFSKSGKEKELPDLNLEQVERVAKELGIDLATLKVENQQ